LPYDGETGGFASQRWNGIGKVAQKLKP